MLTDADVGFSGGSISGQIAGRSISIALSPIQGQGEDDKWRPPGQRSPEEPAGEEERQ
jgi:hypothetical protein